MPHGMRGWSEKVSGRTPRGGMRDLLFGAGLTEGASEGIAGSASSENVSSSREGVRPLLGGGRGGGGSRGGGGLRGGGGPRGDGGKSGPDEGGGAYEIPGISEAWKGATLSPGGGLPLGGPPLSGASKLKSRNNLSTFFPSATLLQLLCLFIKSQIRGFRTSSVIGWRLPL